MTLPPLTQPAPALARPLLRTGRVLFLLLLLGLLTSCAGRGIPEEARPAPLPVLEASAPQPQVLWSRSIGQSGDRFLWQVRPGLLEDRVIIADAQGQVLALDLETGRALWETRLPRTRVSAGMGVGEGMAVLGTLDGLVIGLDAATGEERWRQPVSSEVIALSSVAEELVVVRTNDGRLHALEAQTGSPRWSVLRATPALSLRGGQTPLLLPGRVLAGFDAGTLLLLGSGRGNVLWETTIAVPRGRSELERLVDIDGRISVLRNTAFVAAYQGRLVALELNRGEILWEREFSSYQGGDVQADAGLQVITASDSHVWGIDLRTGGDLWQQSGLRLRGVTAPLVVGPQAIVGDQEGYLHWMNIQDGRLLARVRVGSGSVVGRPEAQADRVYALTTDGRLTAVQARVVHD
jgi:outer membrane protein assembly factor BamB